jgi:hypothetical protein
VEPGYEAALGAALADDLRAPEVKGEARSGWAVLPGYAMCRGCRWGRRRWRIG